MVQTNAADVQVVGLVRNLSNQSQTDLQIRVALFDQEDNLLVEQVISPLIRHFTPNETGPFSAMFNGVEGATSTRAEVTAMEPTKLQRASVRVEELATHPAIGGNTAILGYLVNPASDPVLLHALSFLVLDVSGEMIGSASLAAGPSLLEPDSASPFLAMLHGSAQEFTLIPYPDATITKPLLPIEINVSDSVRLQTTSQGIPFVVGEIHNQAGFMRWARLLVSLEDADKLIAFNALELPVPLNPGEIRAFSVTDFPGLASQLEGKYISLDDLDVKVAIEPNLTRSYDEVPIPLEVAIDLFEPLGSSLFLRGTLTNTTQAELREATIIATMRTTAGGLLTAGWISLTERLPPGESLEFVLPLTLPQQVDLVMSEFDIQAIGFAP